MSEYQTRLQGKHPIFLLTVTWGGYNYRFATKPVVLTGGNDVYNFDLYIDDPNYIQKSQVLGVDFESYTIPFAVYISGVHIAKQHAEGNILENSKCEFAYILEGEDNYNERVIIANGLVSQPVYGYPNKNTSYVEFSLESENFVINRPLLDSVNKTHIINKELIGFQDAGFLALDNRNFGKIIPIVFGRLDVVDGIMIHPVPLYYLGLDTGLTNYNFTVACHDVLAETVNVVDGNANTDTGTIQTAQNLYQEVVQAGYLQKINERSTSFVQVQSIFDGGDISDPLQDNQLEFWASVSKGLKSPFGDDVLEGGGDVCLWALSTSGANIDYDAWYNLKDYLNNYKFAGVIKDEKISGFTWLQAHILPNLPIEIILSKNGLSPRLNLLSIGVDVPILAKITAGSTFYRNSPLTPATDINDIINDITIRYAYDGSRQSYLGTATVGANLPVYSSSFGFLGTPIGRSASQYSVISQQIYGEKKSSKQLQFVYDRYTAFLIAFDIIRANSQPVYTAQYAASSEHGYLQLGDIIELTDMEILFINQKCQIISKQWNNTHWLFDLKLEHNHIANKKTHDT